jgi:hypothetical protein
MMNEGGIVVSSRLSTTCRRFPARYRPTERVDREREAVTTLEGVPHLIESPLVSGRGRVVIEPVPQR